MGNQPSTLGQNKRFSKSRQSLRASPSEPVLRRLPGSTHQLPESPTAQHYDYGQFTRPSRRETFLRPVDLEVRPATGRTRSPEVVHRQKNRPKSLAIETSQTMRLTMGSEPMLAKYPDQERTGSLRSRTKSLRRSASILSNTSIASIVRKSSFIRKRASRQSLDVTVEDIPPVPPTPVSAVAPPPPLHSSRPFTPDFEVPVLGVFRRGTLHIVNGAASPAPSEATADKLRVSQDEYFTADEGSPRRNASPMRAVKHMKEAQRRTSKIQQSRQEMRRTFELDAVEPAIEIPRSHSDQHINLLPSPAILHAERQVEQYTFEGQPVLQMKPQRPPLRQFMYGSREHAFQILDGGLTSSPTTEKHWERPPTSSADHKGPVYSLKKADSLRTVDSSSTDWPGSENISAGSSFTSCDTMPPWPSPEKDEYLFAQPIVELVEVPPKEIQPKASRGKLRKARPASQASGSVPERSRSVQRYRDAARLHIAPPPPAVPSHIAAQHANRTQNFSRPQSVIEMSSLPEGTKPIRIGHIQRDPHAPRPPAHQIQHQSYHEDNSVRHNEEGNRGRPLSARPGRRRAWQEPETQSRSRSRPKSLHSLPLDSFGDFVVAPPMPPVPRHHSMMTSTFQNAPLATSKSHHSLQGLPFSRSQPMLALSPVGNYALAYESQREAERVWRESQRQRISYGESLGLGRYQGGFGYGYEAGRGISGSAGLRGDTGRSNTMGASRKSVALSEQWGVDLSDVPLFLRAQ